MAIKILVLVVLAVILYCLGSGLYHLARQTNSDKRKLVVALTWRIILSVCLFLFLLVAYFLGWIHPHMIMVGAPKQ